MRPSLQVWLTVNLVLCCWSLPLESNKNRTLVSKFSTVKKNIHKENEDSNLSNNTMKVGTAESNATASVSNETSEPDKNEPDENGIAHIIKHSKLFTEFVSFSINPAKSADMMETLRNGFLVDQSEAHQEIRNSKENITVSENKTWLQQEDKSMSVTALQQLFIEMAKNKSSGIIISFDYLNVTKKASGEKTSSLEPVRMWGILPNQDSQKTVYFIADLYSSITKEAETKKTVTEQINDFEVWKEENLIHFGEFTDDKLGDGTIGALLG